MIAYAEVTDNAPWKDPAEWDILLTLRVYSRFNPEMTEKLVVLVLTISAIVLYFVFRAIAFLTSWAAWAIYQWIRIECLLLGRAIWWGTLLMLWSVTMAFLVKSVIWGLCEVKAYMWRRLERSVSLLPSSSSHITLYVIDLDSSLSKFSGSYRPG